MTKSNSRLVLARMLVDRAMMPGRDRTNCKLSAETLPWQNIVPGWTWENWWISFDEINTTDHIYQAIKDSTKESFSPVDKD